MVACVIQEGAAREAPQGRWEWCSPWGRIETTYEATWGTLGDGLGL